MRKLFPNRLAIVLAAGLCCIGAASAAELVSRPGEYRGYSPAVYDGYQLTSRYVEVRDGTRIAIDIIRPTLKGVVVDRKLPVVWMNTPYNRSRSHKGPTAEVYPGAALALVKYGYVVAIADMRGNYASFGKAVHSNRNEWMPWAYWDAYDITEWLAAQPWSDSKVGMWGCSATGHSQWQAAATRPPHLKTIFPLSAPSEYYHWGGVGPASGPAPAVQSYPGAIPKQDDTAVAVDGDEGKQLLNAALEEHRWNLEPGDMPYRDSTSPELQALLGWGNFKYWLEADTFSHLDDINRSGIPAYESSNYGEDIRVKLGVMVKLANIRNPMKLIMGPGNHCVWSNDFTTEDSNPFNISVEEHRWYDYWLKGIQNGIMDEPPIYYYTYNTPRDQAWKFAWQWPLPQTVNANYYLGPIAADGSGGGVNKGTLGTTAPSAASAGDRYTVDYSVTPENRDQKGLTYTTPPLDADTTATGHPVVHLWIASSASDGDFLAYLADVAPDGKVTQLPGTDDGQLRASHRTLNTAPYDNLGLPYHRSYAKDVAPLTPGTPVELSFDMAPISWVFKAGHRIRLTITAAAPGRRGEPSPTPVLTPAPVVTLYRDQTHRSHISMPLMAPIAASVRLARAGRSVAANLTFPKALDRRYIHDVKPGSIMCNGERAIRTRLQGDTLIAECSAGNLAAGGIVTIEGQFGNKYDYGDRMTFTATGSLPK